MLIPVMLRLAGVRAWRRISLPAPPRPGRVAGAGQESGGALIASVVVGMSAGHGPAAAAHKVERKLGGLKALYVHLEQEESLADSAAFRTEKKLKRLGHQKENDDLDYADARQWLDALAQGGAA